MHTTVYCYRLRHTILWLLLRALVSVQSHYCLRMHTTVELAVMALGLGLCHDFTKTNAYCCAMVNATVSWRLLLVAGAYCCAARLRLGCAKLVVGLGLGWGCAKSTPRLLLAASYYYVLIFAVHA